MVYKAFREKFVKRQIGEENMNVDLKNGMIEGMDIAYEHSILSIYSQMLNEEAKIKVIEELCLIMEIKIDL